MFKDPNARGSETSTLHHLREAIYRDERKHRYAAYKRALFMAGMKPAEVDRMVEADREWIQDLERMEDLA